MMLFVMGLGSAYHEKADLQNAADAASLAASQETVEDAAHDAACTWSEKNDVPCEQMTFDFADDGTITVTVERDVTLAPFGTYTITATANARAKALVGEAICVDPEGEPC